MQSRFLVFTLLICLILAAAPAMGQTTRIMPCGDSITYDNYSGDTRTVGERISYRYPLWQLLTNAGADFRFVGGVYAGYDIIPDPQDAYNEGWPGWTDAQVASNIYNWLVANPADIVLLHIGTNAVNSSPGDVENILDEIDRYETDYSATVHVVLAKIINRITYDSTTSAFNTNIENMAAARVGDLITMVDMENGAGIIYAPPASGGDMIDNLHPTDDGYAKMAKVWFDALLPLMPPTGQVCDEDLSNYLMMEKEFAPYVNQFGAIARSENPPTWTTGRVGQGQLFDLTNEVSLEDDDSLDWASGDSFTLEFWMKKTNPVLGTSTNDNQVILGRDDAATSLHWWVGVAATTTPPGKACFQLRDTSGNGDAIYSSTNVQDGAWHHVAAVRDGAAGVNYLYVDGAVEDSLALSYPAGWDSAGKPMNIGWLDLTPNYHYDGIVDEIAVHDRALDGTELTAHYVAGTGGLGYCTMGDIAPVITSTPVTEIFSDQLYSYDVQAVGNPAPAFSLLTSPAGMTIDPVSGLIGWTPSGTGDFPVEVDASNSEGTDTQSFTLSVLDRPICTSGLELYWKLEETSGSTYADHLGGLAGQALVSPPSPASPGIVGDCQDFNGTTDFITVADDPILDWSSSQSFTIELWFNATNVSSRNKVMIGRDQAGSTHWWLGLNQNTGYANWNLLDETRTGVATTGSTALNDGQWHHLVAVRDHDLNENRLYVDGGLADSATYSYGAGFGANTTLGIGYMAYSLTPDYFFDGMLDEVALYAEALSEQDILDHWNSGAGNSYCQDAPVAPVIVSTPVTAGIVAQAYTYDVDATGLPAPTFSLLAMPAGMTIDPASGVIDWLPTADGDFDVEVEAANSEGADTQLFTIAVAASDPFPECLVSWWRLDETAGPPYLDMKAGFDGSAAQQPAPAAGKLGGAMLFDGADDEVDVLDVDQYDWAGDASFSVEFWMKTGSGGANHVIVGRDGGAPSNVHWWVGTLNTNTAYFGLRDSNNSNIACPSTTLVTDGAWHHIVAVRDGTLGQNQIWVDGVNENSVPAAYTGDFTCAANLNIGYLNLSGHYRYPGLVDEVAIYCRALTSSEIQAHFNSGAGLEYSDPIAPVITTTPPQGVVSGQVYSYDVESTGAPTAAYGLTTGPAGMTIDPVTGVLSLTTGSPGDYDVTVSATNSAGEDTQSFIFSVAPAPVCPQGLTNYWHLDESSGTTYFDTFAGLHGSASPVIPAPDPSGVVGGAQYFNGTSNDITVPDDTALDWGSDFDFSIEIWAKTTESTGNNQVMIGRDQGGGYPHWWLGVNNSGVPTWNLLDTNKNGVATTGQASIRDGNWHHLVAVRDDNLNENRLYVDGNLVGTSPYDYTAGFEATTTLGLGYMAYNGTPGYFYKGSLDEVALYTRALTPGDIQQNYQLGLAGRGYCEDNIAPAAPTGFAMAYGHLGNDLVWNDNPESDLADYLVYSDLTEGFVAGPDNLLVTVGVSGYFHPEAEMGGVSPFHVFYQVAARDLSGNISAPVAPETVSAVEGQALPARFALHDNVPNPFNPMTTIRFDLPTEARISLRIFDISGRLIAVLKNNEMESAGRHEVVWRGRDQAGQPVAAGVYFYRMEGPQFEQTRRMVLVK